jgi:hypothetical protein
MQGTRDFVSESGHSVATQYRSLWADFVVKVGGREARALARFLENGLW